MKKGLSIKTKVTISAIAFMGILTLAIATVGYKLYRDSVMESYTTYADTVLVYAVHTAEEYSFGDMIAARQMPEAYEQFRLSLNQIKDSSRIEYLYAIYFEDVEDLQSLHYAINAKSQEDSELITHAINELLTKSGFVNLAPEDVQAVTDGAEFLTAGEGTGEGDNRAASGTAERWRPIPRAMATC